MKSAAEIKSSWVHVIRIEKANLYHWVSLEKDRAPVMQLMERDTNNTKEEQKKPLTSLELFAGAGGLAVGTHLAGFKHLGLIEWDAFAVQTLKENSERVLGLEHNLIFQSDIRAIDYTQWTGKIDLLSGGPPCQPFSTSGRSLGPDDPRDMFPAFLDTVAIIRPNAMLIENVKGLLRDKFKSYFAYIMKRLQFPLHKPLTDERWQDHFQRLNTISTSDFADDEQYIVTHQLVNTADYGVPQRRERVLITAFRKDLGIETFHIPATHSKEALLSDQWITGEYWRRHNVEPHDYLGPANKQIVARLKHELFPVDDKLPWRTIRDALCTLPPPVTRGQPTDIANHVQHPGAREYAGHKASTFDYPAKVLKAGTHGTPGGENMVRIPNSEDVRYFTTREAARLQTFPDEWIFHGSWGSCIRQLGNAVPAELIRIFASEMSKELIKIKGMIAL